MANDTWPEIVRRARRDPGFAQTIREAMARAMDRSMTDALRRSGIAEPPPDDPARGPGTALTATEITMLGAQLRQLPPEYTQYELPSWYAGQLPRAEFRVLDNDLALGLMCTRYPDDDLDPVAVLPPGFHALSD